MFKSERLKKLFKIALIINLVEIVIIAVMSDIDFGEGAVNYFGPYYLATTGPILFLLEHLNITEDFLLGILISIGICILRIYDFANILKAYSNDYSKDSYKLKCRIINAVNALFHLSFLITLVYGVYKDFMLCYQYDLEPFILELIFLIIPLAFSKIVFIIVDIMGLCYKPQEKQQKQTTKD